MMPQPGRQFEFSSRNQHAMFKFIINLARWLAGRTLNRGVWLPGCCTGAQRASMAVNSNLSKQLKKA